MQNFSPLALKLNEEFEVIDRHIDGTHKNSSEWR